MAWTAKQIQPPYIIAYGTSANAGDSEIRQYAEAGVNIIQMNNWGDVSEQVRTTVCQIAQKYHVGLLPWAFGDRTTIPAWSKNPAIFGWFMWDEPGRDEPYPLSLRQQVYRETKNASGGLPMVSVWDDPVWGMNIGEGLCDIVGYEVAYPFELPDIPNPLAFTTARCKLYGYGGGTLQKAQQAGMIVIPVLQSWVKKTLVPDIPGQYQAYLNCFATFNKGVYLYDPVNHIIKNPGVKAYVQQLTKQLGGTIWTPPSEPEPTPERTLPTEAPKKIWKQYTCPNGDVVEITNYDHVGCYSPDTLVRAPDGTLVRQTICPMMLAPTMQKCPVEGLPVAEGYDIRLIQEARPAEPGIVGAATWHEIICPRCTSVLKYKTQAIDPKYFKYLDCPVCEKELGIEGLEIETVIAKTWPLPTEPIKEPTIVPIGDAQKRTLEILESLGWKPPSVPTPTPALPEPTFGEVIVSAEWWKENWPWVGVGVAGLTTIAILAKGGK